MSSSSTVAVRGGLPRRHAPTTGRAQWLGHRVRAGSHRRRWRETCRKHRVGRVGWMPLQPLEGFTVGVTADRRASEPVELLRRSGARVLDCPPRQLVRAILDGRVHALTFASAPAVRHLFTIADEGDAADDLRVAMNTTVVTACVGPACADA